jgi:hypothetical protein
MKLEMKCPEFEGRLKTWRKKRSETHSYEKARETSGAKCQLVQAVIIGKTSAYIG